jgi:hypothetical protein
MSPLEGSAAGAEVLQRPVIESLAVAAVEAAFSGNKELQPRPEMVQDVAANDAVYEAVRPSNSVNTLTSEDHIPSLGEALGRAKVAAQRIASLRELADVA